VKRPTVILKKTHASSFGNHVSQSSLTSIYGGTNASADALIHDKLHWGIYEAQALSFASRFVLISAGVAIWDKGWNAVRDGVRALVFEFRKSHGNPTILSERSIGYPENGALWFLQTPDGRYLMIAFEPSTNSIHLTPVFSVDPRYSHGSIDALKFMFPENAEHGVEALSTLFCDPHLPSAPRG